MKMQQVESNIGAMELALVYAKRGHPMPEHLDTFMKLYLASSSVVNAPDAAPDATDAVPRSTAEASSPTRACPSREDIDNLAARGRSAKTGTLTDPHTVRKFGSARSD